MSGAARSIRDELFPIWFGPESPNVAGDQQEWNVVQVYEPGYEYIDVRSWVQTCPVSDRHLVWSSRPPLSCTHTRASHRLRSSAVTSNIIREKNYSSASDTMTDHPSYCLVCLSSLAFSHCDAMIAFADPSDQNFVLGSSRARPLIPR